MMLARSATLRRAARGSPSVTTKKVGVSPTGSTTTKRVSSPETAKSSGMAGIVPASRAPVLCTNAKGSKKAQGKRAGPSATWNGRDGRGAQMAADSAVTVAARLDRLPPSRYALKLIALLSLGGWFEFYDLFFTAYVAPGLFKAGLFKPTTPGLFDLHGFASFVAAFFAGLFVGTLAFSWVSDRFGRRSIFTFSLLWYSIGDAGHGVPDHAGVASICGASSPASASASSSSPSTPISPSWCRRNGAARPSPSTSSSVHRPCRSSRSSPGCWCRARSSASTAGAGSCSSARSARSSSGGSCAWPAGIAALAGAAWPHARKPSASCEDFERAAAPRPARALPPPQPVAGEAERKTGSWCEIWRPPYRRRTDHADRLQSVPDRSAITASPTGCRRFLLAQGIEVTKIARLHLRHRDAANPFGPLVGASSPTGSSANGRSPAPRSGIAVFGLLFSQQTTAPRRDPRAALLITLCEQLAVVLVPRLSGRALSDAHPRPRGRLRLFLEPVQHDLRRLRHRLLPRPLRHHRRLQLDRRRMVVVFVVIGIFGPAVTRRRLEAIAA